MYNFSEIIKKYKIKCYDERFDKIIIQKYIDVKNAEENDSEIFI